MRATTAARLAIVYPPTWRACWSSWGKKGTTSTRCCRASQWNTDKGKYNDKDKAKATGKA